MKLFFGVILAILATASWAHVAEDGIRSKKSPNDLYQALFANYNKNVRPVKDHTESITTQLGLSPVFIRELDEEREILIMDTWVRQVWHDDYLTWNPDDYDGIKELIVPSTEVWKPDITLYSGSPSEQILLQVPTNVILYATGAVMWVPPVTVSTRCPLDFSNYPYDTQLCVIKFGSWTLGKSRLDIQMSDPAISIDDFMDNNPHWNLNGANAARFDRFYPCCPNESYPNIEFNVTLRRKQSAPVQVAQSVSYFAGFLALLMFWLPPDSVHKIMLGALADVCLGMTVLYVGTVIPAPLARLKAAGGIFTMMCAVSGALIIEVLIVNLARVLGPSRPPRFLVAAANGLCRMLCVCSSRPYSGLSVEVDYDKMTKHTLSAQEEWKLVAMALDRILFIVSIIISVFFCKLW